MIQTIRKAWAIPELRKKIIFTALILLIFRIGNAIPVPYVDTGLLKDYIDYMHIKDADAEGVIVPPGKGCALLEETLRSLNADYPDRELVLTMEPHLMMFTGLSSLSKLDDIKHKYSFSTPFEAFETATSAVREMLARL